MQVCSIEELRNKIAEEDFEEIYQEIEKRLEASIEFTEEDYSKDLEQIENERNKKLQDLIKKLAIEIDTKYFQGCIEIFIKDLGYKTSAGVKKVQPKPPLPGNTQEPQKPDDEKTL